MCEFFGACLVIVTVILALFGGFCFFFRDSPSEYYNRGRTEAIEDFHMEAVKFGVAEYRESPDGSPVFHWKSSRANSSFIDLE